MHNAPSSIFSNPLTRHDSTCLEARDLKFNGKRRRGEGKGGEGKGGEKGKIWERRRGEGRPTAGLLILCKYKENYFGGCRDGLAVKSS